MSTLQTTIRRTIRPPSGYEGFLSRRQTAAALGFASEFKVRRLEREGRLRPVRGVMGSAWYARAQVLALRDELTAPPVAIEPSSAPAPARWSDAQLIAHLRTRVRALDGGAGSRPRTAVDLVAETGISIARAERVYRFWLSHDAHPVADEARGGGRAPSTRREPAAPSERRSEARIERDVLLRQMRDADPSVRATAFEKLRALR